MSELPAFPTFQDRDLELDAMTAGPSEGVRVLNFHGEAGIGKSRLLKEGAARLNANPKALALRVRSDGPLPTARGPFFGPAEKAGRTISPRDCDGGRP